LRADAVRSNYATAKKGSPRAAYGASENGGYLSVTSTNAYAITRVPHRMTPSTKSNIPLGYRPVNKTANQAMITTTRRAIHKKNSTMKCGMTSNHFTSGSHRFKSRRASG